MKMPLPFLKPFTFEEKKRIEIKMRPKHRKKYDDFEWQALNPAGKAKYKLGDCLEMKEGGFGVVSKVSVQSDTVAGYSIDPIKGFKISNKCAWFYENDVKRCIAKSPLHKLEKKAKHERR